MKKHATIFKRRKRCLKTSDKEKDTKEHEDPSNKSEDQKTKENQDKTTPTRKDNKKET